MVKALIILFLTVAVFGTASYFTYELYIKPEQALRAEKKRGPPAPPPDPSLPEFAACLDLQKKGDTVATRAALTGFLDHFPNSPKADEARDILGGINAKLFLSQTPAPEKQIYVVAKNDVLNRVALRTRSTPELIFRSNNLTGTMLRINQKLVIPPANFSAVISLREKKVTLFNAKHFFKQYRLLAIPAREAAGTAPVPKRVGKVISKFATDSTGNRVTFQDKGYAGASHEVSLSIPGHSLYALTPDMKKPVSSGLGLSPEDVEEIAVLLKKNDPVTIQ
ncbi:MAG: LysM peptidoglycan-binding domain-containing protein [Chthoniobacteraceae bacterium]